MPDCKQKCIKITFPYEVTGRSKFTDGFQLCLSCRKSIKYDGLFCPCCNCRLRASPRHGKYKRKLLKLVKRI